MSSASLSPAEAATSAARVSVSISGTSPLRIKRGAGTVEQGCGLLHGVAGAELRLLAHEGQARRSGGVLDLGGAVPGDDDRARSPEAGGGVENVLQ